MGFIDIIFFAAIAIFLGYRLWSLLGTHDIDRPLQKRKREEEDIIIPIRPRVHPTPHSAEAPEAKKPNEKNDDRFLQGAILAFRNIVEAYAKGDVSVLHKLLKGPLLETFEDTIAKRKQAKKSLEVSIERIISAEVIDRWEEKDSTYTTVRFVSQQCLVTRNEKGKLLEGDPDQYHEVTDIWTFSRPLKSTNPNWALVATQLPEE